MATAGSSQTEGGRTLFWLAATILGGLLFAAGVMVGRRIAPRPEPVGDDPLATLDRRHAEPAASDDQSLVFPDALSGPPTEAPRRVKRPQAGGASPPNVAAPVRASPAGVEGENAGAASRAASSPGLADEIPEARDTAEARVARGSFRLQVASFREREQAERLVERLKADGLPAVHLVTGDVPGKGRHYRVRLGRFAGREPAEAFNREHQLEALVVQVDSPPNGVE